MKRRVDLLVSPKFLAAFFRVELVQDAETVFDPAARGVDPGGQIRVPVWADVPAGVDEVEGTMSIIAFPPHLVNKIGHDKAIVGTGVKPMAVRR